MDNTMSSFHHISILQDVPLLDDTLLDDTLFDDTLFDDTLDVTLDYTLESLFDFPLKSNSKVLTNKKRKINKINENSENNTKKLRIVHWRVINSAENERMRGAVFIYRFYPMIPSNVIQKAFGISVKTLMRYVYFSCDITYEKYNLYFGEAGKSITGNFDRALERNKTRLKYNKNTYFISNEIPIPIYANKFIKDMNI